MIHYFLFDYSNSGEMYRIGVQGDCLEIEAFLLSLSRRVIYIKSSDNPHKKEKGKRKLPCGIVRTCKFHPGH